MIFAEMMFAEISPEAVVLLALAAFIIFMVVLIHWSFRDTAPATGKWDGSNYTDASTIAGYLVDPDTKLPYIFVTIHAITKQGGRSVVDGKYPYKQNADEICKIKLIRSGSGFRVYSDNHKGEWMSCR